MPAAATAPEIHVRHGGNAHDAFNPAGYVHIPGVSIFPEHATTARDGRKLNFGRQELEAVAARMNRRIKETGDFSMLTVGHTPDPATGGGKDPPVIGYAGPFHVGLMQKQEPGQRDRFTIFADFHVFADKVELLRQYPRRSPELWLESTYEEMILDPVALLGSELPRLDQGLVTYQADPGRVLYEAEYHGRKLLRYTAVAPGAMNSFVPSTRKYEAGAMLAPEDIRQIVEAVSQTEWAQWCQQQMAAGAGGAGAATPPPAEDMGGMGSPPAADAGPPAAPAPPPSEPEKNGAQRYESGNGGPAPAMGNMDRRGTDPSASSFSPGLPTSKPQPYSRQAHDALEARIASLQDQVEVERAQRVNTERRAALSALATDGVRLDVEAEMKRLCYGRLRNDGEFNAAVKVISDNYQRDSLGESLPDGGFRVVPEETNAATEHYARTKQGPYQYTAAHRKAAKERCLRAADRGEKLNYDEVLADIAAGRAG